MRRLVGTTRPLENPTRPLILRAWKLNFCRLRLRALEIHSRPLEIMPEAYLGVPILTRALEKILKHPKNYSKAILRDFLHQIRRFNFHLN